MAENAAETDALDHMARACERVGRFLYHFALLEQAIGGGVAKLLKLDPIQSKVVMANLDFTRKVNILFSAESEASSIPKSARKKELENTFSVIMRMNERRIILAHSPFTYVGSEGVRFDRVTARKRLLHKEEVWTDADFDSHYREMTETALTVDRLVAEMEPYVPSLDLSDPRNSALALAILL